MDAFLSITHWWFVLALVVTLGIELALCRGALDRPAVERLTLADGLYGLSSGLVLVAGTARVVFGAKGWVFYVGNPVFWIKIALFLVIAGLSVRPTFIFVRWRKTLREGGVIGAEQTAAVRRWLHAEAVVLFFIPIAAALMARGIGL